MTVIDAHVHLYPPEISADPAGWAARAGEGAWASMSVRRRKNGAAVQAFPCVADLLGAMDAAGIERSVLVGWYWETQAACDRQNRFYAELVRSHPDRFSAFATVQLKGDTAVAVEQLHRALDAGLCGLGELCPHAQGYPILGEAFDRLLQTLGARPVLFHASDPSGRSYPGKVETPHPEFLSLARAHPDTPFILAHWGGQLPLLESGPLPPNLFVDTAASPLLYDPSIWRKILAKLPAERVLFGSDYPLTLYPNAPLSSVAMLIDEARASGLPAEAIEAILSTTARTLLASRP